MEFLEVPLFDEDIYKLIVRFGIDLVVLLLLVFVAIFPNQRDRDFVFTAVMLNIIVFFICFTMKKLELDLGLALGLFAVFGVLRYRTDAIRPKEMTYLFIVIGVGVINALANKKTSYAEIALVNSVIVLGAIIKESFIKREFGKPSAGAVAESEALPVAASSVSKESRDGGKKCTKCTVEYDRLDLLSIDARDQLLADLEERLKMSINRAEVKTIDMLQNKATLTIWAKPTKESVS
ncbi:MAG: DUF4956 domain-containing protein [Pirellulaceae bacterium]